MKTKTIVFMIIMAVILLSWLIGNIIYYYRKVTNIFKPDPTPVYIKCEKCGNEYQVSMAEFIKGNMTKKKSCAKTELKGPIAVNAVKMYSFAKKFHCPECNKKRWGQVLNYSELDNLIRPVVVKYFFIQAIVIMAGFMVLVKVLQFLGNILRI